MEDGLAINERLAKEFEDARIELVAALKDLTPRTYLFGGIDEFESAAKRFDAAQDALRQFGQKLRAGR